jgi:alpha-tubulin suppressor-like RCC1 family protein
VSGRNHLTRECGVLTNGTLVCTIAGAPAGTFTSVRVGPSHACALRTDGTLACWGDNTQGQSTPPAGTFVAVDVGDAHTCAIRTDGSLACFGANASGQAPPP